MDQLCAPTPLEQPPGVSVSSGTQDSRRRANPETEAADCLPDVGQVARVVGGQVGCLVSRTRASGITDGDFLSASSSGDSVLQAQ